MWGGHRRTGQATAEQADRGFKQAQQGAGLLLLHSTHLLSGRARPFKASSVRVGAAPRGQQLVALASAQAAAGPARGRLALPLHMGHSQAQQRGVQALCGKGGSRRWKAG